MNEKTVNLHAQAAIQKMAIERKEELLYHEGFDLSLKLLPDVFRPFATDTLLLGSYLQAHTGPDTSYLDLTTGSGVLCLIAAKNGAHGVASDISPQAVRCAQENFAIHNANFIAVESDGFNHIPKKRFDLITFNPPYIRTKPISPLQKAIYSENSLADNILPHIQTYLKPQGEVIFTVAEWAKEGDHHNLAKENGLSYEKISHLSSQDGKRTYALIRCKILNFAN